MRDVSLATKRAYFERVKLANYRHSLRLEGIEPAPESELGLSKDELIRKYRRAPDGTIRD
ncbi:YhfG family protein [Halotalea alkalilenta]|uniref:YhfG family protein n=1 Tax=Halotalea alkalilenta TaxID=376489 RepID=UPI001CBB2EFB